MPAGPSEELSMAAKPAVSVGRGHRAGCSGGPNKALSDSGRQKGSGAGSRSSTVVMCLFPGVLSSSSS